MKKNKPGIFTIIILFIGSFFSEVARASKKY